MDLQPFLLFSAASFAIAILGNAVIHRTYRDRHLWSILAVYGLTVVVAGVGFYLFPDYAGYASVFMLFLALAPGLLANQTNRETIAQRPAMAAFYARLAMFLHPTAQRRFSARLHAAIAEPEGEHRIAALQTIMTEAPAEEALHARFQLLIETQDWHTLADLVHRSGAPAWSAIPAIRALGESGDLYGVIAVYSQIASQPRHAANQLGELCVLAFWGRVDAVRKLLAAGLSNMPAVQKQFWEATALQAAGRREEATHLLQGLAASAAPDERRRHAIALRLADPVIPAPYPPAHVQAVLRTIEANITNQMPRRRGGWLRAPVTLVLLVANFAMFGVEIVQGGAENLDTLISLGALLPDEIVQNHQWWRLISAMFLHAGPEHLAGNMFALWLLGTAVEDLAGSLRMALIYGLGGLASMAGVVCLTEFGWIEPGVLVGASGAIFALIGAIALRRVRDYLTTRTVLARRNLTMIGFVVLLQTGIDLAVPQISLSAHLIGLLAGLVLSVVLLPRAR